MSDHDPLCLTRSGEEPCNCAAIAECIIWFPHDPLCDPKSRVVLHDRRVCDCNFIARVRADEREAAAQRVLAVKWGWYDDTQQEATINRDDAVRAAYGGDAP